ncbi:MAG: type I-E CRISPR-associated protein Cse2/CasB [Desulfobulbaceae bacterium]|nr:type I-E CRISPR-associated protein Cse2/CasB [Desulfobulbaceae bacterium]
MSEYIYLSSAESNALQNWHSWLDKNRGNRARLRRAERAEDVLLTDAFFHFLQKMPESWRDSKPIFSSAAIAGLLAHVKEDRQVTSIAYRFSIKNGNKAKRNASFAELLARPPVKEKKPPMSEIRFQQLQKSRSTDEFYRNVRRAIQLLDGKVNILSLANDIVHWHREFNNQIDRHPSKRLAVRWATDYFTILPQE